MVLWQCVHNGQDRGKGKEVILWEKIREQGKKGEHRLGPRLYWAVGQLGMSFQRKPISEAGNCTGMWKCYLQKDIIILISLYRPLTLGSFWGHVREEEKVAGGNHTAPAESVVPVQYDF